MTVRTQRSQEAQAEPTEGEAKPEATNRQGWRSEGAM